MTVSTEPLYAELSWTGAETAFAPGIKALAKSAIALSYRDDDGVVTGLTDGVHLTLSLDSSTGIITALPLHMPVAPGTVIFQRTTPPTQSVDFVNLQGYDPKVHMALHDASAMRDAELGRRLTIAEAQIVSGLTDGIAASAAVLTDRLQTFDDVEKAQARINIGIPEVSRERLSAPRTIWVRDDGNDANNGRTDSAGGAKRHYQAAIDMIANSIDFGGQTLRIEHGTLNGQGNGAARSKVFKQSLLIPTLVGGGRLVIAGNFLNTYLTSDGTSDQVDTITAYDSATEVFVEGFAISNQRTAFTGNGNISAFYNSRITVGSGIDFGVSPFADLFIHDARAEILKLNSAHSISAGKSYHWFITGGEGFEENPTQTQTNNPHYSGAYCFVTKNGQMQFTLAAGSYPSGCTGNRAIAVNCGFITPLDFDPDVVLPGDQFCVADSGSGGVIGGLAAVNGLISRTNGFRDQGVPLGAAGTILGGTAGLPAFTSSPTIGTKLSVGNSAVSGTSDNTGPLNINDTGATQVVITRPGRAKMVLDLSEDRLAFLDGNHGLIAPLSIYSNGVNAIGVGTGGIFMTGSGGSGLLNISAPVDAGTLSFLMPTVGGTLATQEFVISVASNLGKRQRVRAKSPASTNITISAPGATIDGVTMAAGDQFLLNDQSAPAQNGVYQWNGAAVAAIRVSEFDTYDEHPGSLVAVEEGSTNADTIWLCTSNVGGTLGTTAIAFAKLNVAGELFAANNLSDLSNAGTARTNLGLATVASSASAADLSTGTLASGRLSGSYTGITGTGTLTAGATGAGFTIALATSTVTGALGPANGGTGVASYAVGDLLYASGSTTLSKLADVATGNVLISGGVTTAPAWGKVALTTHVSGTLPVANGGTGGTTSTGSGAVMLATSASAATDFTVNSSNGFNAPQLLLRRNASNLTITKFLALLLDGDNAASATVTDSWNIDLATAANPTAGSTSSSSTHLQIAGPGDMLHDHLGDTSIGARAALATNATKGFLQIPTMAGTPSGTPTNYTGKTSIVYDSTAHKLWAYDGAWKSVALT